MLSQQLHEARQEKVSLQLEFSQYRNHSQVHNLILEMNLWFWRPFPTYSAPIMVSIFNQPVATACIMVAWITKN